MQFAQRNIVRFATLAALASVAGGTRAAFNNGTLFLVRVGDGTSTVFNSADTGPFFAANVSIDEYNASNGSFITSHSLASSGTLALTLSTNFGDDSGRLNLSPNGQFLTIGGYRQDASNAGTNPAANAATTTPRVLGLINSNWTPDTTTARSAIFSGVPVTSVLTNDGTHFWAAGSNVATSGLTTTGGLQYIDSLGAGTGAFSVTGAPATDSFRNARLIGDRLYVQTPASAGNRGVSRLDVTSSGKAIPNATTDTVKNSEIIVSKKGSDLDSNGNNDSSAGGTGKLYPKTDIHFFDLNKDGVYDTAYSTGGKSDLEKWTYGGSTSNSTLSNVWSRTSSISLLSGVDINAIDAAPNGNSIDLFLSSDLGVYKLTDTGGSGSLLADNITYGASVLNTTTGVTQTSGTYTGDYLISVTDAAHTSGFSQFRGLALIPVPEPTSLAMLGLGAVLIRRKRKGNA